MPRARNIKPGFFENEHLGELPGDIQLLFIGLWTQSDREGVIEYRIGKLRKALFGFRPDMTLEVFNRYITVLEQVDHGSMLVRVPFEEKEYLVIANFGDHQKPHHTEKKGKLPSRKALLEAKKRDLTVNYPLDNRKDPFQNALIPDLLIPDLLIPDTYTDDFENFWNEYGKIGSKQKALKVFKKIKGVDYETIIAGLRRYQSYARANAHWYHPQHASTWLNDRGWESEYPIEAPKQSIAQQNINLGIQQFLSESDQ